MRQKGLEELIGLSFNQGIIILAVVVLPPLIVSTLARHVRRWV